MQLGSSGSPRPDVYALPKAYAKFRPLAYECKISVADFRRDVTSGKWQSYLKFACGVVFAVPRGLVNKTDIPATCGLIVRHESGWRMAKAPSLIHLQSLPHEAWMKLLIDGIDRVPSAYRKRCFDEWKAQEVIRRRWGDKLAGMFSDVRNAEYRLQNEKERLEKDRAEISEQRSEIHRREKERLASERQQVESYWGELRATLGLPDDAARWDIGAAVRNLIEDCSAAKEVERATEALNQANQALVKALKRTSASKLARVVEAAA